MPDNIVVVSKHVKSQFVGNRFNQRKLHVIENGIDCSVFKKIRDAKERLVDELNIDSNKKIGFIGRYSFEKRPSDFLKLAARLNKNFNNLHFLMVGDGNDKINKELMKLIAFNRLGQNISLLGVRDDMPAILSSLDLLISTSVDEAFGLVLIEALACGCPCVSSNNEGAKSVGGEFIRYV